MTKQDSSINNSTRDNGSEFEDKLHRELEMLEKQESQGKVKKHKFPNIIDLLVLFGVFFLSNLLGSLVANFMSLSAEENLGKSTFIIYLVSFGLTLLFTVPYSYFRSDRKFNPLRLSLRGFNMLTILWGFVLILSLGVIIEPLTASFDDSYLEQLSKIMGSGDWFLLSALVLAPLFEEILFRGVIQGSITSRYGAVVGIVVSSVIFGLVHGNPIQMCNAFFIGLVFGYIYHRTNTIWSVVLLHFFNNAFSYLIWMIGGQQILTMRDMISSDKIYDIVYISSSVITLISFVLLFRALSRSSKKLKSDNKDV